MPITISGSTGIAGVDGSASTPAVQGTDTNTGIYFGADAIYFTEGGVQCAAFDSSANFQFNSGYGSVATAYGCRAWVNFNGTGTIGIRGSGNVSSITDGGVGTYTVNFTTAMPDINYSTVGFLRANVGTDTGILNFDGTPVAGNTGPLVVQQRVSGANYDPTFVCVAVFR